jgi:hypothetical protein
MDLWHQWEAVLHNHDDPNREARARLFYEANLEEMNAWAAAPYVGNFPGSLGPSGTKTGKSRSNRACHRERSNGQVC